MNWVYMITDGRTCLKAKKDIVETVSCTELWASDGPAGIMLIEDLEQVRVMLEQLEAKGTSSGARERV